MKQMKYYGALALSVLCIAVPLGFLLVMVMTGKFMDLLIPFGIVTVACFAISKATTKMRTEARRDVEYDEYGLSKTKGSYDRLSKAERDAIDLQRTADMERVLDTTAIKKMTKKGSEDPDAELADLVGLEPVKKKMHALVARMQFEQLSAKDSGKGKKKKKKGASSDNSAMSMSGRHMALYGGPGTGKTTITHCICGYLYKYGYIKENKCIEVDGNFLKAGADTALKTEMICRQAFGGVLFIDEAYALMESGDGTGKEAIATLIKQMEDNRGKFVVILAGYTREMQNLLAANPGFESRIKEYIDFPDYDAEEMREIFRKMAKSQGFTVAEDAYPNFDARVLKERRLRSFGNARTARNILDESIDKHALNFVDGDFGPSDQFVLHGQDISPELKRAGFQ